MFDKKIAKAIQNDMLKAIKALEEKYNVSLGSAGGSFDETEMTLKFKVVAKTESGKVISKEEINLDRFHPKLKGAKIRLREGEATIVGFNPSKPKWAWVVQLASGKRLLTTAQEIERQGHKIF